MKTLLAFILPILAWLASLFGSNIQPRTEDAYPAPNVCATPIPLNDCEITPTPNYADIDRSTPVPTDAMWRHYSP